VPKKTIVTYGCEQCGSKIVVTSTGEGELSPIYCCGIEVAEIPSKKVPSQPTKKGTKAARTATKRRPIPQKNAVRTGSRVGPPTSSGVRSCD